MFFKTVLLILILLLLASNSLYADQSQSVRNDYSELKLALQSGKGATAAELVTTDTINIYERGRKLALSSDGVDFADILQTEILLIFQLRYLASKDMLKKMTGRDVFAWGVSNGLVKKDTLAALELNQVQIEGDEAFATLSKNGKPEQGIIFNFKKKGSRWQLEMVKLMSAIEPIFEQIRNKAGKTKIELAIYLLERTYGKPIPPTILNGPLK